MTGKAAFNATKIWQRIGSNYEALLLLLLCKPYKTPYMTAELKDTTSTQEPQPDVVLREVGQSPNPNCLHAESELRDLNWRGSCSRGEEDAEEVPYIPRRLRVKG